MIADPVDRPGISGQAERRTRRSAPADPVQAVLDCGRAPLEVLDGVIDGWVAAKKT